MYDVSHKKEKLSMCMYDVIVKQAKIMRQKHKNMFESVVLIVKRAKTRANAREKHKNVFESVVLIVKRLKTRARGAGSYEAYVRTLLTQSSKTADFNKYSNLISPRESYIYIYGYRYRE